LQRRGHYANEYIQTRFVLSLEMDKLLIFELCLKKGRTIRRKKFFFEVDLCSFLLTICFQYFNLVKARVETGTTKLNPLPLNEFG